MKLGKRDELARKAAKKAGLISFAGGLPDPTLFPARELGAALRSALTADAAEALQYGWPEGAESLRAYVARDLRARGADVRADRVIITSGAQQAIALCVALMRKGSRIGVEPESYPGALDIFRTNGAKLCQLPEPAQAYYVMPSLSNPRGQRMSDADRATLLSQAARQRAFLLEDDAYEGTCFSGQRSVPLLAEAPERVFHIGTFSKTLCPGLRIGWLVPPRALASRVLKRKQNQDLQANSLAQALLVRYLEGEHFSRHQQRARARYHRKAALLAESVRQHLPELRFQPPRGGFSLWVEGDFAVDEERLLATAIREGVSFDPGSLFRTGPNRSCALRLCYSTVDQNDIAAGVSRLATALARARRNPKRAR